MGDPEEVEHIETLDDLSSAIQAARKGIEGSAGGLDRRSSIQVGLSIKDVVEAGRNGSTEMQEAKDLLEAWQTLVEALFSCRIFLKYATSLETCIGELGNLEKSDVAHMRTIVDLMRQTVEMHKVHECSELRYVTLLNIMLSYNDGWAPTADLNDLWAIIEQSASSDVQPDEFRRQAYGVLVSLPWVPSSCGLYCACSMEMNDAIHSDLPPPVRRAISKLGDDRLYRFDLVHSILHRIRRNEVFRILISAQPQKGEPHPLSSSDAAGVGKSSLAALLAAHPKLAEKYSVLWVELPSSLTDVERDVVTFDQYMDCLVSLCQQLSVAPNWPEPILRLENSLIRIRREKEFMTRAKHAMSKLLQQIDNPVLLVIDSARDEKEFELFNFLENQSSIIISQSKEIKATCTMPVGPLTEDEALQLFAIESDIPQSQSISRTHEAKAIIDQCRRHPLIVRTAARWFKVKQASAGVAKALEELTLELSILRNNSLAKTPISKVMSEVMNIMLSPARRQGGQPTRIMKLCLASFAVVFREGPVPLDAVLALWSQVLVSAPPAREELGSNYSSVDIAKRAWFTTETFVQLGLFNRTVSNSTIHVAIHHQMYTAYGLSVLSEVGTLGIEVEDLKAKWHEKFVNGYLERRQIAKQLRHDDPIRDYALKKLVYHMIEAKSIPKVLETLRDDKFYRERIKLLGWRSGTDVHLNDCLMLKKKAKDSKSATPAESRKVVLSILKKMASVLVEDTPLGDDQSRIEKAKALHVVGFTQADNYSISEALTQYKLAMQLVTVPNHPFHAVLMYSQAVLHLSRNDHEKALKKVKACQKILKETSSRETSPLPLLQLELIQLKGDAFVASCDYLGAATCYEEALDQMKAGSRIEVGSALFRRGRLHQLMGELQVASSALAECITWKMDLGEKCSTNLAEAYSHVGDIHVELQDERKAIESFEKALEVLEELEDEAPEVDRLLLRGKLASLRGNIESSRESFEAARGLMKKSPRMFMDRSAYDMRCMARICMDRGDKQESVDLLEDALELTIDRVESLERGSILYDLGQCMNSQGENREAMACFEESLEIRRKALGDCELVLDTLTTIGDVYKSLNLDMQRLGTSQQVLDLTQKIFRHDDEKLAAALFGFGEAQESMKAHAEAVTSYTKCRDLLKRVFGSEHMDVANVLIRLADLHKSHGDYEQSHQSYLEALEIRKANLGPESSQLGETLFAVGVVSRKKGDLDSSRNYLLEALEIQKQLQVAKETCWTLAELGTVYRLMREPDGAISCLERCISILDPQVCEESLFGKVYLELGHAKLYKSEFIEAMESYNRALQHNTKAHGKNDRSTAMASRSLGFLKYILKEYSEAQTHIENFVRIMDAHRSFETADYVMAMDLLGEIHRAASRPAEATKKLTVAKQILEKNPQIDSRLPGMSDMVSAGLESASQAPQEKSLFSRFTELARFEDEVSGELSTGEKVQELIRSFVFLDDY